MKKFLIVSLFMTFALALCSSSVRAAWTNTIDFETYKSARAAAIKADNAGDFETAAAEYMTAGKVAESSADASIACWQYNNAAYALMKAYLISEPRDKSLLNHAKAILEHALELNSENKTAQKNLASCEFWLTW